MKPSIKFGRLVANTMPATFPNGETFHLTLGEARAAARLVAENQDRLGMSLVAPPQIQKRVLRRLAAKDILVASGPDEAPTFHFRPQLFPRPKGGTR